MKYDWKDLPKPLNVFTVRNTVMMNLNNGKTIQHYSANTKITLVQKAVTPQGTFYRTSSAEHHYLNYAFKASDFGLPDEYAPPVPPKTRLKQVKNAISSEPKQKSSEITMAKGGEPRTGMFKKILKRVFKR